MKRIETVFEPDDHENGQAYGDAYREAGNVDQGVTFSMSEVTQCGPEESIWHGLFAADNMPDMFKFDLQVIFTLNVNSVVS